MIKLQKPPFVYMDGRIIDWDDANETADAHFDLKAIFSVNPTGGSLTQELFAGETFNSTTDDSVLTVDSVDTLGGVISFTVMAMLSPGMHISAPPWSSIEPVTSVVRM